MVRNSKGFTLIELVIVIVILGILSATVAPKFIDLQSDAKTARLQGLKGAMESALDLAHSKLIVDGLENQASVFSGTEAKLKAWCDDCLFYYGYPGNMPTTWMHLLEDVGPETDITLAGGVPGYVTSAIFAFNDNVNSSNMIIEQSCYIRYTPTTSTDSTVSYELALVPCED